MHIGVDARELLGRPTGVGRYLAALLEHWTQAPRARDHRITLYAPAPVTSPPTSGGAEIGTCVVPGRADTWWQQTRLCAAAARDDLDVFFAPAYSMPLALRIPTVVNLHDVSFVAHPEWFRPRERLRRRWLARGAAWQATRLVTVSEFSKGEIVRLLGVPPDRVSVIPQAVALPSRTRSDGDTVADPLPSRVSGPLLLFVGSVFNRRHVPDLIRAFARLSDLPTVHLVVVGENRTFPHQDLAGTAGRAGVAGRVHLLEYLSDPALEALYRRARAFAFPSIYEGFGLTPLEAIAHGLPTVVYDTPVSREVYADAAIYVPAGDADALASALRSALTDDGLTSRLRAAGARLLPRYSWDRTAGETLDTLLAAARTRLEP